MPNTTNLNIPYPDSNALVSLGYDQIGDVATGFDAFWTFASFTSTIAQGGTSNIGKTVTFSQRMNHGTFVLWQFVFTMTAAGTAANDVILTLPFNCDGAGQRTVLGTGHIWDNSTTINYTGNWVRDTASTMAFLPDGTAGLAARWGTTPNLALAANDIIAGCLIYKKA